MPPFVMQSKLRFRLSKICLVSIFYWFVINVLWTKIMLSMISCTDKKDISDCICLLKLILWKEFCKFFCPLDLIFYIFALYLSLTLTATCWMTYGWVFKACDHLRLHVPCSLLDFFSFLCFFANFALWPFSLIKQMRKYVSFWNSMTCMFSTCFFCTQLKALFSIADFLSSCNV